MFLYLQSVQKASAAIQSYTDVHLIIANTL